MRAAEALRAAQLWASSGWGCVWSLGAALFARFLVGPRDALQSFGATESKVGQERELELEALTAVWTGVVGRTCEEDRQKLVLMIKTILKLPRLRL